MGKRRRLYKDTDYETACRCAGGDAILREEVWIDEQGDVARYNLALLMPHLFAEDNGRVLGYDNAHGPHERHYMGEVATVDFDNFEETSARFYREAEQLRKRYDNKADV